MTHTGVRVLVRRSRVRAEDRRAVHRRMGDVIGRAIVTESLINARTFTCETCGQTQGLSQLERVPLYACKRRAPEVECTSCRVVHEDGCSECMATLTTIGTPAWLYLQEHSPGGATSGD